MEGEGIIEGSKDEPDRSTTRSCFFRKRVLLRAQSSLPTFLPETIRKGAKRSPVSRQRSAGSGPTRFAEGQTVLLPDKVEGFAAGGAGRERGCFVSKNWVMVSLFKQNGVVSGGGRCKKEAGAIATESSTEAARPSAGGVGLRASTGRRSHASAASMPVSVGDRGVQRGLVFRAHPTSLGEIIGLVSFLVCSLGFCLCVLPHRVIRTHKPAQQIMHFP